MSEASIKILCSRCRGSGIDDNEENPDTCAACSGTGYSGNDLIDTTDIMEQLGAIRGKVNAIWNQVKPGA